MVPYQDKGVCEIFRTFREITPNRFPGKKNLLSQVKSGSTRFTRLLV